MENLSQTRPSHLVPRLGWLYDEARYAVLVSHHRASSMVGSAPLNPDEFRRERSISAEDQLWSSLLQQLTGDVLRERHITEEAIDSICQKIEQMANWWGSVLAGLDPTEVCREDLDQ